MQKALRDPSIEIRIDMTKMMNKAPHSWNWETNDGTAPGHVQEHNTRHIRLRASRENSFFAVMFFGFLFSVQHPSASWLWQNNLDLEFVIRHFLDTSCSRY